MILSEYLARNKLSDRYAVIYGEDKITYQDLYKKSSLLAKKISREISEVALIFIPNNLYYVIAYFAILGAKKIAYPISSLSKTDELYSALERTNCSLILTTSEYYEQLKISFDSKKIKIICLDNKALYDPTVDDFESFDANENRMEDTCLLLNTSGSTDKHKIVMLTHRNIVTNCSDWIEIALEPSVHGNVLVYIPASTSFGSIVISTCIMLGWTIIFMPVFFNAASLLEVVEKEKVTHLISMGTILNILALNIEKLNRCNYHSDSLKFIGVGGNGAVPETIKVLMDYFKEAGISSGYGITEATCMVSTISPGISRKNKDLFFEKIKSAGKPFKHSNITIFNDGVYVHTPKVTGEILVSGPILMKGYLNNMEETKTVIKNGYLHTGDIGYLDEDGYLYIVGRSKNIIKSGGYTIFPEEIETVLLNSKMLSEAYVYGVWDSILDEKIVANVIPINNTITVSDIMAYCNEHLAKYKIPTSIQFVNKIQKTKNGKIQRKVLKRCENVK